MTNPSLLLISGSLRRASFNRMLAAEAARHFGAKQVWADLDLPLYNGDVETADGIPQAIEMLAEQISAADAVVISTPEYNQSLSGVLKNMFDWVSRVETNPWQGKPVAIMSAAAGRAGGARAQYALRLALNPFQPRLLTGPEVMMANPQAEFGDTGRLQNGLYQKLLVQLMGKLRDEVRSARAVQQEG